MEHATTASEKEPISWLTAEKVKLSNPLFNADSILFTNQAIVEFDLGLEDVQLMYQMGSSPKENEFEETAFELYTQKLLINQTVEIKLFASKDSFQNSDTLSYQLIKMNPDVLVSSVSIEPSAAKQYAAAGPNSLFNKQKGRTNFKEDSKWMGFQSDTIKIKIDFDETYALEKIYCSLLSDHASWIFLPEKIEIWSSGKKIGEKSNDSPLSAEKSELVFEQVDVYRNQYKALEILIINGQTIPDWHPGKGTTPWLFIDEIIFE